MMAILFRTEGFSTADLLTDYQKESAAAEMSTTASRFSASPHGCSRNAKSLAQARIDIEAHFNEATAHRDGANTHHSLLESRRAVIFISARIRHWTQVKPPATLG
jgi:hypothetical protein